MSVDDMRGLVTELEEMAKGGGYADPVVIRRAERICTSLGVEQLGWSFELDAVKADVEILYSVRKHDRVPGGIEGARTFLLGDCHRLRMKIAQYEAAESRQ